jgi:tellurite resistance protein TerC
LDISAAVWVATVGAVMAILLADLWVVSRRPHKPGMHEAARWVAFYIALALAFCGLVWAVWGQQYAGEFLAGYLTEYSLSLDNLFVFVLIMARFRVPASAQQTVLVVGIVLALVFRGIFIAIGAVVIAQYSWIFYFFGVFLIYTAWKLAFGADEAEEFKENALLRVARRVLKTSPEYDGVKLRTTYLGERVWTPLIVVMVAIGTTDVLFALDSIPAIFGLTQEPYLVFTANAFALMGLMQLYFLLGGLLDRLVYLPYGLAVILGFIGVKLIFEALHTNALPFINGGEPVEWAPEISTALSLSVIVGVLLVTTVASVIKARREHRA